MDKTIKNGFSKLFFHDGMCSVEVGINGLTSYERKKLLYRNIANIEIIEGNLLKKPIFVFYATNGTFYMPFDKKYMVDAIALKDFIEDTYTKGQEEEKQKQLFKEIPKVKQSVVDDKESKVVTDQNDKPKIVLQATMPDFATKPASKEKK